MDYDGYAVLFEPVKFQTREEAEEYIKSLTNRTGVFLPFADIAPYKERSTTSYFQEID